MSDQADHHPAEELLQQGNAAFNAGLLEVADDLYRRALPLFEALPDEGKVADVICNLGSVAWERNDLDEAERLYDSARDRYEAVRSYRAVALVEQLLANVAYGRGDLHRARWYYYRALAALTEAGEPLEIADCRVNLAALQIELGQGERALRHLADAEASYREHLSDDAMAAKLAEVDENAGLALRALSRHEESRARLTRAHETYERLGRELKCAELEHNLAGVAWLSGRAAEAADRYRQAIDRYRRAGREYEIADCLLGLGLLSLEQGDLRVARSRLHSAAALYENSHQWLALARVTHNLGLTWRDDPHRALSYVVPAWAAMQSLSWGLPEVAARAEWGIMTEQAARIALELASSAGEPALLAELVEAMRATALRPGLPLPAGITSMESAAAEMPSVMPPEIDCGWPSRLAPYVDQGEQLRAIGGGAPQLRAGSVHLACLLLGPGVGR